MQDGWYRKMSWSILHIRCVQRTSYQFWKCRHGYIVFFNSGSLERTWVQNGLYLNCCSLAAAFHSIYDKRRMRGINTEIRQAPTANREREGCGFCNMLCFRSLVLVWKVKIRPCLKLQCNQAYTGTKGTQWSLWPLLTSSVDFILKTQSRKTLNQEFPSISL